VFAVYRAYGKVVYAVAYRALGDKGLAEEATQQAFLKAWRAAATVDPNREFGPWLAAIARRSAIDVYRREAVRVADPLDTVPVGDPALTSSPRWRRCTTHGRCARQSRSYPRTSRRLSACSTLRA
jgi:RNA polymerase sigma factor (sigma-70 family)